MQNEQVVTKIETLDENEFFRLERMTTNRRYIEGTTYFVVAVGRLDEIRLPVNIAQTSDEERAWAVYDVLSKTAGINKKISEHRIRDRAAIEAEEAETTA